MNDEPNPPGKRPESIQPAEAKSVASPGAFAAGAPAPAAASMPAPGAKPTPAKSTAKAPVQHDSFREFIETIVFVVVLVLILKTFLAEAFVIPTGSMATTLLGYHGEITCEQCGYRFLVNKSKEADPAEVRPQRVTGCTCENCGFFNQLRQPLPQGGPQ